MRDKKLSDERLYRAAAGAVYKQAGIVAALLRQAAEGDFESSRLLWSDPVSMLKGGFMLLPDRFRGQAEEDLRAVMQREDAFFRGYSCGWAAGNKCARLRQTTPAYLSRYDSKDLSSRVLSFVLDLAMKDGIRPDLIAWRVWAPKHFSRHPSYPFDGSTVEIWYDNGLGQGVELEARRGAKKSIRHEFVLMFKVNGISGYMTPRQIEKSFKPISTIRTPVSTK